jgi:phosphoglycolate phosphatase-like HAD superfamily hydrolase
LTSPTPGERVSFDAVVFDLDGTLVATDRFWIEAAGRGARRAFAELGLEREVPGPHAWLGLVGTPLEQGFEQLFPELSADQRRAVLRACVEEETRLLADGRALAMPGARAVVAELHSQGVQVGIASNCQGPYLAHMLRELDIQSFLGAALCRDTPGVASKADMIARLLEDFGTQSAVMVGDRASDRDAARANRIPHVHCAFGFAQGDEDVEAEGRIESLEELPRLLARRGRWIDHALERVGAFRAGTRLGIAGGPGTGKTLFARDAARRIRARGLAASVHSSREPQAAHSVPAGAVVLFEGSDVLARRGQLRLDRVIRLDSVPAAARRGAERADLELRAGNPLGEEPAPDRHALGGLGAASVAR